jgi:tRNA (adenine22-N1)-methyltransferase
MDAKLALSQRLKAVADMVPACDTVADIGCDHGKAAAALLLCGKAARVVCGDISAGSLDKARRLAHEYALEGRISLRLGSGLSVLEPGEANAAILAGMGGMLIARILEDGADRAPDTLVLSPNRDAAKLRGALAALGWRIEDEALVLESRHFYPVIRAVKGSAPALTDMQAEFGPVLLQKKPELLKKLVQRRIAETRAVMGRLEAADSPRAQRLLKETDARLQQYAEVLSWL